MYHLFGERKLVFNIERDNPDDDAEIGAKSMGEGKIDTSKQAEEITGRLSDLRAKLGNSDLLTEEDQKQWKEKIERVKSENLTETEVKNLESEFAKQQNEIKGMVDTYTQNVLDKKKEAFAFDPSKNVDTAKEYIDWFQNQSYENKVKALSQLDGEIKERVELRRTILDKRPDLAKEVQKLRRHEMADLLGEIEESDKNIAKYEGLLKKYEKHFSKKSLQEFREEFADLTLKEQDDYIRKFEKEYGKPREELTKKFNSLPEEYKDSKFNELSRHEKVKFFEQLEAKIDREFKKEVDRIPRTIWSEDSKRFAIDDFMRIDDVSQKAYRLKLLPDFIEAEENLTKKYNNFSKDLRELDGYKKRDWEQSSFNDKELIIRKLETEEKLMKIFTDVMKNEVGDQVISKKTQARYMKRYMELDLTGRTFAVKEIGEAMKTRRKLMDDFNSLDTETKNQFKDFFKRGHRARLQIYKDALKHEEKMKVKKEKDKTQKDEDSTDAEKIKKSGVETAQGPKGLEQSDVQALINELQAEAETFESTGNLEKALGRHETVLKLHPENVLSKRLKKELEIEIETADTWTDETVQEVLEKEAGRENTETEFDNIELAQQILAHYEQRLYKSGRSEDMAKQDAHLTSEFDKKMHREIVKQTGGKFILNDQQKIQEVQSVDVGKLGNRKTDVHDLKEQIRNLKHDRHLENVDLRDEMSGKKLTHKEASDKIKKRKKDLAKKMGERALGSEKLKTGKMSNDMRKKLMQEASEKFTEKRGSM